jgi:hypothetical protein
VRYRDPRRSGAVHLAVLEDGGRDLWLEQGFSQLESEFVKLRDSKLARQQPVDAREHALLCAFVAATHARTPTQRDHLADMWGQVAAESRFYGFEFAVARRRHGVRMRLNT